MKIPPTQLIPVVVSVGVLALLPLLANPELPEKPYLDAILERQGPPTQNEINALDQNNDGQIDVRDLVIFLDGQPVSVSFVTDETVAYLSEGSVSIPIEFSKPVSGELSFLFGEGEPAFGQQPVVDRGYSIQTPPGPLDNATASSITVVFENHLANVGMKDISITIDRQNLDGEVRPGRFSSHLVRLVSFDAGEFDGLISFDPGMGFHPQKVRIGLNSSGSSLAGRLYFTSGGSPFGDFLDVQVSKDSDGQPVFNQPLPINMDGSPMGRDSLLNAALHIDKLSDPYPEVVEEFLAGYVGDNKPAPYEVSIELLDLYAAGGTTGGSFTISVPGFLYLTKNNTLPVKP